MQKFRCSMFSIYLRHACPNTSHREKIARELVELSYQINRKSGRIKKEIKKDVLDNYTLSIIEGQSGFGSHAGNPRDICQEIFSNFQSLVQKTKHHNSIDQNFINQFSPEDFLALRTDVAHQEIEYQTDLSRLDNTLTQSSISNYTPYLYIREAADGKYAFAFLEFHANKGKQRRLHFCLITSRSLPQMEPSKREVFALVGDVLGRGNGFFLAPTLNSDTLNQVPEEYSPIYQSSYSESHPALRPRIFSADEELSWKSIRGETFLTPIDTPRLFTLYRNTSDSSLTGAAYITDGAEDGATAISPVLAFKQKNGFKSAKVRLFERTFTENEVRELLSERCPNKAKTISRFDRFTRWRRFEVDD